MRRSPPLRIWLALLGLAFGLSHASPAAAYAWMIKHGFSRCGTCHTDPSGGETLTLMGRVQAQRLLSFQGDEVEAPDASSQFLLGGVPEPADVRLGGSYRHLFLYTAPDGDAAADTAHFPMQLDLYGSGSFDLLVVGGSLGVARGIEGSAHVRGAQLNRDLGDGWLALSRSHFLGLRVGEQSLLRVGRLNLPFGVRVPEHVLWARDATRTDRESDQQHGLAFAHSGGRLRLEGMVIAGNFQVYPDRYRERGYSVSVEYSIGNTSVVGLSSLVTRANEDRFTQTRRAVRHAHGAHGRLGLSSEWVLLAELDLLKEGGRGAGYTGFVQVDYEPLRGLHFMLTGEALDQGALTSSTSKVPGSGEARFGAWASSMFYLYSHLELRLDVVRRQESPWTVQAQLHLFL